ncbi:hypothetical protein K3172_12990 [Qipengyuania sp. 6B39]|uniref:hypothetical protein n=1 Tax=Qipengyuania proteolytica TaxID=2867239 RepID=UPI001C89D899|nr:hypothetical protein [Qipengyuania proteolytica]MBX7496775.1 hypothetical protein [Qipengyuania proteolytica]
MITDSITTFRRRLSASLAPETGGKLIEETPELASARKQLLWVSAVVWLLLLARPEDGRAEISLFTSLDLPYHPLLLGLLGYLGFAGWQFYHQQWRFRLSVSKVSEENPGAGHLDQAISDLAEKHPKIVEQIDRYMGMLDSATSMCETNARLRLVEERLPPIIERIEHWQKRYDPTTNERSNPAGSILDEFYENIASLPHVLNVPIPDVSDHEISTTRRAMRKQQEAIHEDIREFGLRTDDFFTLSNNLKRRDRAHYMALGTLVPIAFAGLAFLFAANTLIVAWTGPAMTAPKPFCPVCPVEHPVTPPTPEPCETATR